MATVCEYRGGSGKNLKVHFDFPDDDDEEDRPITPQTISRSSSSSSNSSIDLYAMENDACSEDSSPDFKHTGLELSKSRTEFGYPSPVWSFQGGSATTQSPPIQLMNRPDYDPNRIPISIFSSKPTNKMEWSVASNESLFSIRLGNNSLSRDYNAIYKSGELLMMLPPVEEAVQSKDDDRSRDSISSDSSEESIDVDNRTRQNGAIEKSTEIATVVLQEIAPVALLGSTLENCRKESTVPSQEVRNSESPSPHSEKSKMSTSSFQFHVPEAICGRTSSADSDKQKMEEPIQPSSPKAEPAEAAPAPDAKQEGKSWFPCCSCF